MEEAGDEASEAWRTLNDINGIGEDMATDIVGFFAEKHNRATCSTISRREIKVTDYEVADGRDPLADFRQDHRVHRYTDRDVALGSEGACRGARARMSAAASRARPTIWSSAPMPAPKPRKPPSSA